MLSILSQPQRVEISVTCEDSGGQEVVFSLSPDRLEEIAQEARAWVKTAYIHRSTCRHIECGLD